ncbi:MULTISPECIES: class I SAM-dependent methyltransferase [unclassified Streptomyces]|uniref:class I SAM-dependent methyltransferase n=1 Tax=unclassified Streptomyces TaxID=2593676 RepID=UPI00362B80EF
MRTVIPVHEWDAHFAAGRDFRPVTSDESRAFDLNIGPGAGRSALDIGCGTGGFASFLQERGYAVVGADYAGAAISAASARHHTTTGLSFRRWNAEVDSWVEFPARDLISCRLSYAFIQNKTGFLANVRAHLSPGGIFYVMTPLSAELPPNRKETGVTAEEIEELHRGWHSIKEWSLDAQHAVYVLTL